MAIFFSQNNDDLKYDPEYYMKKWHFLTAISSPNSYLDRTHLLFIFREIVCSYTLYCYYYNFSGFNTIKNNMYTPYAKVYRKLCWTQIYMKLEIDHVFYLALGKIQANENSTQ